MRAEIVCNFQSLRILARRTLLLDVHKSEKLFFSGQLIIQKKITLSIFLSEMFLPSAAPQSRCQELFCPAGRGLPSAKMMSYLESIYYL